MKTTRLRRLAALWALAMSYACGGDLLLPTIEDFSPRSGTAGTRIAIQGIHFDRDGAGYPSTSGDLPWQVYLMGADRKYLLEVEDATDHSLLVVVPEGARSGTLAIVDSSGTVTETEARFEVLSHPAIRVINDAQFDVVDLRFNGQQMLVENRVLESGVDVTVSVPTDRYRIEYAVGRAKEPWVWGALPSVEVTQLGAETIVRIPPIDVIDVLAVGGSVTDWVARYRGTDDKEATATLRIQGDGAWALFSGAMPIAHGTIVADPIATYAHSVAFRLSEGGVQARLGRPFTSFVLENGPAHWPLLEYVRAQ